MTRAILYKYINCTVDKLLALALVTNYITIVNNNKFNNNNINDNMQIWNMQILRGN